MEKKQVGQEQKIIRESASFKMLCQLRKSLVMTHHDEHF